MRKTQFSEVNKAVRKIDGVSLVTGRAKYTDDFELPGMLHAKLLRSPHASARIKKIRTARARKLPGVAGVLTYRDLPRIPSTTSGVSYPEPFPFDKFVLDKVVRFIGDEVAVVAAESEKVAEQALALIEVEYEVFKPLLDPRRAMQPGSPIVHAEQPPPTMILPIPFEPEINRVASRDADLGDVDQAIREAFVSVEREFESQFTSHVPIEPHCAVSWLDEHGRLMIITATQVPFHVRRIVARYLNLPINQVRVIKPRIGGAFGGKTDIIIEPYIAALTLKTGRPVKIRFSREEVFVCTRLRHNIILKARVAANRAGNLTALDLQALLNTGAYGSQALTVAGCVPIRTLSLWNCPNLRYHGDAVYTNLPVAAAYRGFGNTQGSFATIGAMDELIEKLGMDQVNFYLKNINRSGTDVPILSQLSETKLPNSTLIRSCELPACIWEGAKAFNWKNKRNRSRDKGRYRRGVGMTIMMQGSSIAFIDLASAFIKMNDDGSFNLLMGATELGQGSDTILAQIVAEELTVNTKNIIVYSSDTDLTPFDKGAYASSTTYLSGNAVKDAAARVKDQILHVGAVMLNTTADLVHLAAGKVVGPDGKSVTFREIGMCSLYETNQTQIAASASRFPVESPPPYAADFAEVEVDTYTGKVRVLDYVQAIDCGTVINPATARGQALGAVVNALSFALVERYIFNDKGRMLNPNYGYYKIFGSRDIPPIKIIFVPSYEPTGPFGAKSVGELPINGALPALSNAIYNAVGVRLRLAPFTPDKVLKGITVRERRKEATVSARLVTSA